MRKYETIVVLMPDLQEAQVKAEQKKIETLLENGGAKNIVADSWGRKDLAYAVRKQKAGRFICFNYEAENHTVVAATTSILRITDSVIKYQTHRKNERIRKFKGNPKASREGFDDDFGDSMEAEF